MKKVSLMLVVLMLCGSIQAVTIWTDGSSGAYDDLTGYDLTTGIPRPDSKFSDSADIGLAQTITTGAEAIDVGSIQLVYSAASDASVTLHIFEVADVAAAAITVPGTTLFSETFTAPASDGGGSDFMSIGLDSAVALAANTGYAIYFDTSVDGKVFKWQRTTSTSGDIYAGGIFYDEDVYKNEGARDGFVTLNGVPEPATLTLLGIGMLGLIRKRK